MFWMTRRLVEKYSNELHADVSKSFIVSNTTEVLYKA